MFYQANIKSRPVPVEFPSGLLRNDQETFEVTLIHNDGNIHAFDIVRDNDNHIAEIVTCLVAMLNNNNVAKLVIESTTPQEELPTGPDMSNDSELTGEEGAG